MKILQVLVLVMLICSFDLIIKAQADCRYGLKFSVRDEAGKIVDNAKLELLGLDSKSNLPSYVKLIWIDDAYLFTSHAGQTVNGNFQVKISTDSFETYQQKVNFPVCKIQSFDIQLKPLTKKQNISILTGTFYDASGAVIPKAKLKAINEKGEKFETETNDEGIYMLKLSFNSLDTKVKIAKYEITVDLENRGFEKFVLKDFRLVPSYKGKMNLDIALDSLNPEPCGYSGAECLPATPINVDTRKVSNKISKRPLQKLPKKHNKINKE